MSQRKCTWALETYENDALVTTRSCGRRVAVTFVDPRPGRPGRPALSYPRCKRHSPPAAITEAYRLGFEVIPEEDYELPTTD